jgi:hypothetical protein
MRSASYHKKTAPSRDGAMIKTWKAFAEAKFNDRIIRDDGEYQSIKRYIKNQCRDWDGGQNEFPE